MKPLFTAIFFALSLSLFSQEFSLKGTVVDENQSPLSYVNVILQNTEDETFVKGTSTDDNGVFELSNLTAGDYILKVSFIGFKTVSLPISISANKILPNIILVEDAESLEAVTVTAKRPTITRKPDRLTFNIENTALTEGTTLQVLKSTPGVIVSEGSINIKSAPATIFINNRRVQLTSDELIQLLESAPANSIKSIDVITNPPASYDADSGSVINITMSKNLVTGYRGSIAANYTQGVFPRYNAATSHYFKNNKINFNINYSYTHQKINRSDNTDIDFLDMSNALEELWNTSVNRNTISKTHNLNLNLDYYLSENTTLSFTSTGLYTPTFDYRIKNHTTINDANGVFDGRFTADNNSDDDKLNIGTDLGLTTNYKDGSRLSLNGHFTTYSYERDQNVFSNFFDANNTFTNDSEFNTLANQDTNIYTVKADYSLPLSESSTFDAGAKYSNVTTESSIFRIDIVNGSEVINTANSNAFDYDENVFAGYVNYSKSWENWDLILGVRAEQTNVEGFSPTLNQTNTQDYFEWFPNASISHNFSDNFSLYGNYKRSITRPNYTNLNPFTFFINENTTVEGNPALQPTFLDHFVIGTSFYEYFTIEAYYMNYDGAINEIPRQDNTNNILTYTPVNFDKNVDFGFDFLLDIDITNRWNIYFATSFYNITEESSFGTDSIDLSRWSNYTEMSNNLTLLEDNSLNLNLSLAWVGKNLYALQTVEDRLATGLSVTKTILNKNGIISLSFEDLFNFQDERRTVRYLNQSNRQNIDKDNRFVRLGFRYKFGNTKLSTNERTTSAEERDRIKDLD
ncbi:TonB-dependent receptor domain-containing protein [Winogradskyella jejuensis]|uniref:Outer membrane receptor proteins, mostly Fe transport n=1 Tax=Winogradskyella jejuensis TaxID=1089305 RepID=A0A1M5N316_9FLAO|nr:outer membrane beta-barrel family protein [Winogradskyella jejuensis]SHG83822.1 Outer membrane receptor proteins, mostly Fe transport [Winogradskyella jejuensis]